MKINIIKFYIFIFLTRFFFVFSEKDLKVFISNDIEYIRSFDLGGAGLKTALMVYDKKNDEMKMVSHVIQLGKCPNEMKIDEWARAQLQNVGVDLDQEIKDGYSFGFSLAGLEKLRSKPVETDDMSKLFKLGKNKVASLHDGSAHLLASIKMIRDLPYGRIWNFSIGSGVGFAFTNSKHELRPPEEIKEFFGGIDPWDVKTPYTNEAIWKVGGAKAFDELSKVRGKKKAFEIFAKRWADFINVEIVQRSLKNEDQWGNPSAVVFTGGHIDHTKGRLVEKINKKGLKDLKAYAGPKNAGLYGAAWSVLNKK